jgi:predicted permease
MIADLYHRVRALFRRTDVERELSDELEFHLHEETERLIRDGVPARAARRQAQMSLGGMEQVKEEARDARGIGLIEHLHRDLGHAIRLARKQWGFTSGVAVSLALGLGAATAVFNLTFTLVLADLPIPHPEQLVALSRHDNAGPDPRFTWSEYQALRQTPGVGTFAASRGTSAVAVRVGDRTDLTNVSFVDGAYFPLVGIQALRGRLLTPVDDAQRERVVVLSAWYARRLFGSDTAAVGQTVLLRDVPFEVVGVLPHSFRGLDYPGLLTAVIPMGAASFLAGARDNSGELISTSVAAAPTTRVVNVVGRLATPTATARVALASTYQACCRTGASDELDLVDSRHGVPGGKADFRATARTLLAILMLAIGLVLVVVCCNIASLLLVRASARQKEIAVRLALGGSRTRLVSQLIAENVPAAILGIAGGLVVASVVTTQFVRGLPPQIAMLSDMASRLSFRPGPVVLGFALLLTSLCVVGFSLVPALRATRLSLAPSLRLDSRAFRTTGQGAVARGVVIAQVAVTVVLVSAASLFAVSLRNVSRVDGGFAVDHRLLLRLEARSTPYERAGLVPLMPEILRRVRAVPGVRTAVSSSMLPLFGGSTGPTEVRVPGFTETVPPPASGSGMAGMGGPQTSPGTSLIVTEPGYFDAAGIRLLSGTDFGPADAAGTGPVVIVSAAFQRHYFPGTNALGQTFGVRPGGSPGDTTFTTVRVIGVARDAKYSDLRETPQWVFYIPLSQAPGPRTRTLLLVRTEGDPLTLVHPVTQAIAAAAPGLNALGAQDMQTIRDGALSSERIAAQLAAFVSLIALVLSAVGLYGVIAYSVSRRTSEIGIRLALGAPTRAVLWLIGKETATVLGVGVVVGIPLAVAGNAALRALLYGVGAFDPFALMVAIVLLGAAGLVASVVPARRAAGIDARVALSAE